MHFVRLKTYQDELYMKSMELYKNSFPFHEQRNLLSQREILNNEEYNFDLIYDETNLIGIILFWETQDFIYIEHFCISPEMRNRQYGQQALELMNQKGKTIILEIDPPVNEISKRRKNFYERVQYKSNEFEHIHPPYHEGYKGHSLVVMSYPNKLSENEYNKFNQYLRKVVMNF